MQKLQSHPWHGVQPHNDTPRIVTAFIELVPGDSVKFEIDKESGALFAPPVYLYISMVVLLLGVAAYKHYTNKLGVVDTRGALDLCKRIEEGLSDHYGAPVMLFALLLGMAVNFVGQDPRCRPGIDFMGRTVLRLGVALLGARITLDQVSSLGGNVLIIAAGGVIITILAGWGLSRLLKLKPDFGILTGGGRAEIPALSTT